MANTEFNAALPVNDAIIYGIPLLVTASTSSIFVPAKAKLMYVFGISNGGSGAATGSGNFPASCGGMGAVVLSVPRILQKMPGKQQVNITIGTQAVGVTGNIAGNSGGNCDIVVGNFGMRLTGGLGGSASGSGQASGQAAIATTINTSSSITGSTSIWVPIVDYRFIFGEYIPLYSYSQPQTNTTAYTTFQYSNTNLAASNSDNTPSPGGGTQGGAGTGMGSGLMLPWWVQQVGISAGTVGTNASPGSSGCAGLAYNGVGVSGNGVASGAGGDASGFGAGGGGTNNVSTSGKGAKGCFVIMFGY